MRRAAVPPPTTARHDGPFSKHDEAAVEFPDGLAKRHAPEPYLRLCQRGGGAGE